MKKILMKAMFFLMHVTGMLHFSFYLMSKKRYMNLLQKFALSRKKGVGREYFENELMTYYYPDAQGDVLLIGSKLFNYHYSYFYLNKRVFIVDPDKTQKANKGRGYFINDYVQNIEKHLPKESVLICQFNGVYGWGLNKQEELRMTNRIVASLLNENGVLLFGHNSKSHNPIQIEDKYDILFQDFTQIFDERLPQREIGCDVDQVFMGFKVKKA